MSGYGFTEDSARRIVNAVRKIEGDNTPPVAVGPRFTGSQMSVVKVTSLGSPFATGQRVDYNASANTRADINQVKIKEVNGATLTVGNYYVGLFSGYTTTDDPLFLVNVSGSGGGGNAVIDVVTDVICTPSGLEVVTVQLSGADYDNAVIRNFLALSDVTQKSYTGNQGRAVVVNATASGLEFGPVLGEVVDTFISLSDTPPSYGTGNTYKVLTVSSTNAGISFSDNNITTKNSIKGGGNPINPLQWQTLELVNDQDQPTGKSFYGCDVSSIKGWYRITLTSCSDFPQNYLNSAGKLLKVKQDQTGIEFTTNSFTTLTDSPNEFTGAAGKFVKVNGTETSLEFADVDLTTIESDISTLQTGLESAQTDITTLQTDLGTAQTDISTLQTDLGTAQTNISNIETDIGTIQIDLESAQTTISSILTRLSAAESTISTLQTDLTTAQGNISTLQNDLATAQSNISSLQTDLSTAQSTISSNYSSLDARLIALGG